MSNQQAAQKLGRNSEIVTARRRLLAFKSKRKKPSCWGNGGISVFDDGRSSSIYTLAR
jgi:hypothetical protein